MKTHPVIAIIGATFWGNRGAEAMLTTTIGRLRERFPQARFHVFSYYPRNDRRLVRRDDVQILPANPRALVLVLFPFSLVCGVFRALRLRLPDGLLPQAVRRLRESDVLLDLGGITFVDGRERFLPFNVLTLAPAMFLGVPVVKLSQAMGPFNSRWNRLAARAMLWRCRRIFARGGITADHLSRLGLPEVRWSRAADVAFSYQPDDSLSSENEEKAAAILQAMAQPAAGPWIAFSPSAVMHEQAARRGGDYVGELLTAIAALAERRPEASFLVLPNATREGQATLRNNDLAVIEMMRSRAEGELALDALRRVVWVDFDLNTRSIRRLIGRASVLVTSRFHAMVAGLALGIPTLVVGWSHKYLEVLADFGLESHNLESEGWERLLPDRVEALLKDSAPVRARIEAGLPAVRASSLQQFKDVERLLS
jgi:polysaccharide pyruvyl transferase WcaK-like protein